LRWLSLSQSLIKIKQYRRDTEVFRTITTNPQEESVNKRVHERTDSRTMAMIRYKGAAINGVVENLSLKGLFVNTDQKIDVGEQVEISLYFFGVDSDLSFSLRATVVRATENGLGFNFQKIDVDSLALKKRESGPEPTEPAA
jgi:hypothetical protein